MTMDIAVNLQTLLTEKLELLLSYERYTELLTECDVSAISDYITKRSELANRIDILSNNISVLCEEAKVTPPAGDIIFNRCTFSSVPEDWKPVFLISQSIIACVSRCIEANDHAATRMTVLRAYFERRIRETNNTPKIVRYLSASGAKMGGRDIPINSRKI